MIDIGTWSMAVKLIVAWFLSRTEIISKLGQSMFFPKGFIHKFQILLSFHVGVLENFFQIWHWPHLRFQLKSLKKHETLKILTKVLYLTGFLSILAVDFFSFLNLTSGKIVLFLFSVLNLNSGKFFSDLELK